ncbi:energy transducer TonB [Aureibaculum sp. 2210JD6-5]|uniref:energy transducer TonB n=1 Tax=Aureibaculum sp. 2210JD6-5 TaxID=3103957 RepID=UPI002AAD7707|nr:energy transducer TonB [Aureibaculum sp. 2210JD6-5]MDY7396276.1 energy transducer TonB [Aureibaculum sp. 2210JD6-5]
MIKYFLIIFCAFSTFFVFSQEKEKDTTNNETISFAIIEDAPIFPGCEKLDKKLQKTCLQNQIQKHVAKNFNTKLANEVGLEPGKTRMYVIFQIASDGIVKDVRASGEHEILEKEGIRVISSLPKMTPGLHKGKPVGVNYSLPIVLMVAKKMEDEITDKVNIQYISENVQKIIEKGESTLVNEATYEKIKKLGYKPKDKIKVITVFSIDSEGYIKDVRARGPHKIFEDEAIRIVKQLPKMSFDGTNKAGADNKFTLPITIIIEKPKKEKK